MRESVIDTQALKDLLAKVTPGEWRVGYYDCGDVSYRDHNGPCPSIQADESDCAVVHWDGFKQEYFYTANGNQGQIEANATLIALAPTLAAEVVRLRELLGWLDDILFEHGFSYEGSMRTRISQALDATSEKQSACGAFFCCARRNPVR